MANPKSLTVFHAIYEMMKKFAPIMNKLTDLDSKENVSDEIMQEIKENIQNGIEGITSERDITITEAMEMLKEMVASRDLK